MPHPVVALTLPASLSSPELPTTQLNKETIRDLTGAEQKKIKGAQKRRFGLMIAPQLLIATQKRDVNEGMPG